MKYFNNLAQNVGVLFSVLLLSACTLMPYPYKDQSNPDSTQISSASEQVLIESFDQKFDLDGENVSLLPPLKSTCQITATRHNLFWPPFYWPDIKTGSAALIDGRYLITAAHNVHNYDNISYVSNLDVYCNNITITDEDVPKVVNSAMMLSNISTQKYTYRWHHLNKQFEYDFAFIDLGGDFQSPSHFNLDLEKASQLQIGDTVVVSGYPGGDYKGDHLAAGVGKVIDIDGNNFVYDVKTFTGNSGGPVWVLAEDNNYYVVGIHVADAGLGGKARLLNKSFFDSLELWLKRKDID